MSYVYAYLDPRYPENFETENVCFLYRPIYIGKGNNKRLYEHLKRRDHHPFTYKLRKLKIIYNVEYLRSFIIKVSDDLSHDEAYELERILVETIGRQDLSSGPLCNMTDGGIGNKGISDEIRKQKSQKLKGEKCYMYGVPKSIEIREKISQTLSGKPILNETKEKISVTSNLKLKNPEYKEKRYGKEWSKTSSEMQKGIRLCTWKLINFTTDQEFEVNDLSKFCLEHKLGYETLKNSLRRGKQVTSGNSKGWMLLEKISGWK